MDNMTDKPSDLIVWFLLGRIKNELHEKRLLDVAHWLEQNKFSCTMSIVNGLARFDITSKHGWQNDDAFGMYAAELVIAALANKLSDAD